ncbi:zinc dependent phospholipase C family protein [Hymenobacter sp. RP-2-7]|uniref:Zinc dependent phospholipase C family protein n=1 Tax=Hymenobacter polaris TaxID=2682546 RepID=A0A7Y0FMA2_9BACT|nr:zinc dependent phospholipase C family protein [Hymenobacter polaris]NML65325.1 zinc dependent phospholipase C family protein [Hymenobacter polaris]
MKASALLRPLGLGCLGLLLLLAQPARAYSVLSHQAIIDSCWATCLRPALERRFPGATPDELRDAKAYAYGGSIIQDMGYYPFGSKLFTNLTHYVRSGDFVRHLLEEARDRNGYAFALGALSHYAADIYGHELGVNKSVPILFPKLGAEYGPVVTYEEDPVAHGRTEFAFDVVQLAAGRYRTNDYHDFIGFKVDKDLLDKAFDKTYGLPLSKVIFNVDLAIGSYRFAVRNLIPLASRAAWRANRHALRQVNRRIRRRDYVYKESKEQFEQEYGTKYERPGFGARILAGIIRILPKVGKLRNLKFVTPTPQAQALFRQSFREIVLTYSKFVNAQTPALGQAGTYPNIDIDTGHPTHLGEYALADRTYGEWVRDLAKDNFKDLKPPLRANILDFFANGSYAPIDEEEKEKDKREETAKALAELRALPAGR